MLDSILWADSVPYFIYYDDKRERNADETTWEGNRISIQSMLFDEAGKPYFDKLHTLEIAAFDPKFSAGENFRLTNSVVHDGHIYISACCTCSDDGGSWGTLAAVFSFDLRTAGWRRAVKQHGDSTFEFADFSILDRLSGKVTLDSGEFILLVESGLLKGYTDTTPYHLDDWETSQAVKSAQESAWDVRLGTAESGMVEISVDGPQEEFYSQGSNILSPAFNPEVVVSNKFWDQSLELTNLSRRLYKVLPETTSRHKSTMIRITEDSRQLSTLEPFSGGQHVSLSQAKKMMSLPHFLLNAPRQFVQGIWGDLERLTVKNPSNDQVPLKVDLKDTYCSFGRRGDTTIVLLPVFVTWHWQVIIVIGVPIRAVQ